MGRRLVRDNARNHWAVPGAEHQLRPVHDPDEHSDLLDQKLLEEAAEVVFATGITDITKEIGDVLTVLEAIAAFHHIDWEEVLTRQDAQQLIYGGFTEGLVWDTHH